MQRLQISALAVIATLSAGFGGSTKAQDRLYERRPSNRSIVEPLNDYAPSESLFSLDDRFETQCPGGYCPSEKGSQGFVCPFESHGGQRDYPNGPREPISRPDSGDFHNHAAPSSSRSDLGSAVEQLFDSVRFEMRRSAGYEESLTAAWELRRSVRRFATQRYGDPDPSRRDLREVERALTNLRGILGQSGAPRTLESAVTSFERLLADASTGFATPQQSPSDRFPRFDGHNDPPLPPIPGASDTGRDPRPQSDSHNHPGSDGHGHSHSDSHDHSNSDGHDHSHDPPSRGRATPRQFDEVPAPPAGLP